MAEIESPERAKKLLSLNKAAVLKISPKDLPNVFSTWDWSGVPAA